MYTCSIGSILSKGKYSEECKILMYGMNLWLCFILSDRLYGTNVFASFCH